MSIDIDTARRVAHLARIAVKEQDLAALAGELSAVLAGTEIKARLAAEVELGLSRGVFGSPFVFVDGEAFWGADRLPQLERWLAEGGF